MKKIVLTGMMVCVLAKVVSAQQNPGLRQGQLISPERLQLRKTVLRYERLQRLAGQETGLRPLERGKPQKIKRHHRRNASRSVRRAP